MDQTFFFSQQIKSLLSQYKNQNIIDLNQEITLKKSILKLENGLIYRGEYISPSTRQGFGLLQDAKGKDLYCGYWQDNKYHGRGQLNNLNYFTVLNKKQNWKNMTSIGKGWLNYEGQFQNGAISGIGTLILTNNEQYSGLFKEMLLDGEGNFTDQDKIVTSGMWEKGKFKSASTTVNQDKETNLSQKEPQQILAINKNVNSQITQILNLQNKDSQIEQTVLNIGSMGQSQIMLDYQKLIDQQDQQRQEDQQIQMDKQKYIDQNNQIDQQKLIDEQILINQEKKLYQSMQTRNQTEKNWQQEKMKQLEKEKSQICTKLSKSSIVVQQSSRQSGEDETDSEDLLKEISELRIENETQVKKHLQEKRKYDEMIELLQQQNTQSQKDLYYIDQKLEMTTSLLVQANHNKNTQKQKSDLENLQLENKLCDQRIYIQKLEQQQEIHQAYKKQQQQDLQDIKLIIQQQTIQLQQSQQEQQQSIQYREQIEQLQEEICVQKNESEIQNESHLEERKLCDEIIQMLQQQNAKLLKDNTE